MPYPKSFSHIGLSVPDLDKAVAFYRDVMGFYVLMEPSPIVEETDTAIGIMCQDCFGAGYEDFRIAHLSTSDGIGIEMFEFKQNNGENAVFDHVPTGLFHFSIQDPDMETLIEEIVKHGGKQLMPVRYYYPGEKPYRMCYVQDPFGITFELYSHSYELTYSSGAYEEA